MSRGFDDMSRHEFSLGNATCANCPDATQDRPESDHGVWGPNQSLVGL